MLNKEDFKRILHTHFYCLGTFHTTLGPEVPTMNINDDQSPKGYPGHLGKSPAHQLYHIFYLMGTVG